MTRVFKHIFFIVIVSVVLIGSCNIYDFKPRRNYGKIKYGQQREEVVSIMGSPTEIKKCSYQCDDRGYYRDGDCTELYGYASFLQYWAIAFDKDGKVIRRFRWTYLDGYEKAHEFDW